MQKVFKYVLDNGLTILVRPNHVIPKVSIQMWYGVGSKDEQTGEKGLAHLLEHMIFKGTEKLSESDINEISIINLTVDKTNLNAIELYKKFDFLEISEFSKTSLLMKRHFFLCH